MTLMPLSHLKSPLRNSRVQHDYMQSSKAFTPLRKCDNTGIGGEIQIPDFDNVGAAGAGFDGRFCGAGFGDVAAC